MPSSPGSPSALRTANQQRIVEALRHGTPGHTTRPAGARPSSEFTQADLARSTGLAPATVSNIVRELSDAGIVETTPGSGRRGTRVALSRMAGLAVGVDFGHRHVSVAVGDLRGQVLADRRHRLDAGHNHLAGLLLARRLLDECLAALGSTTPPLRRLVLGLPAPIVDGVVKSSAILPGWVGVNAQSAAREAFGVETHVENDANLGALAEHRAGAALGTTSSVYLKISSGVGAGIIINDQVFHGSEGTAGEIGHLTLDDTGPVCRCGSRGCLEAYASIPAIVNLMSAQLPDAGIDQIIETARDGNVAATRAFEDAGLHLGWGLASVANLINPGLIVIGGDLARAGDLIVEPARIGLRRHALDAVAATPVRASLLADRASLLGAVMLAADQTQITAD